MSPLGEAVWPESLRSLLERVASTPTAEAVAASVEWKAAFAHWVSGASLDERTAAQVAAWGRLSGGACSPAELLFLLSSASELLWPYTARTSGLLARLRARQAEVLGALSALGDAEAESRVRRETDAATSTVLTRFLKRQPESLSALVGGVPCTFDGRALRFQGTVEVDLKQALATGVKSIGLLEQLRALLPATAEEGRDRLADFIRTRAARVPWEEASEVLAERLFSLATSPEGRGAMRGFLACYPNGRKEPDWCARAGVLLARTLEAGGAPQVLENLCELLGRFDTPPVDGLRGALGALVNSDFDRVPDLAPMRFVIDHCLATMRKGEPGLVLTLLWLEERLFRSAVRRGLPDAFERRGRMRAKLEPHATGFAQLCWLSEECADLWPRLSAEGERPGLDALAAWRQEVGERVGRKPMLRKAAIEFFLWCAPEAASSEAELAVLALVKTETDRRQVRRYKDHPSSRVRFRVRTLQTWFQGAAKEGAPVEPSGAVAPASITEALRHLHVTRAVPMGGRTWLRDRDLEEVLFGAVSRVEADFASKYPTRFRQPVVELTAELLDGLRAEMERVKVDLAALLAQGQPAPLEFDLSVQRAGEAAATQVLVGGVASTGAPQSRRSTGRMRRSRDVSGMTVVETIAPASAEPSAEPAASAPVPGEVAEASVLEPSGPLEPGTIAAHEPVDAGSAAESASSSLRDGVVVEDSLAFEVRLAEVPGESTGDVMLGLPVGDAVSVPGLVADGGVVVPAERSEHAPAVDEDVPVPVETFMAPGQDVATEATASVGAASAPGDAELAVADVAEAVGADAVAHALDVGPESTEHEVTADDGVSAQSVAEATPSGLSAEAAVEARASEVASAPVRVTAARRPGVEVAFILDVDVDGFVRTERALFLQVAKLEQRGEGQWLPTFRMGRKQVDELLSRTEASFCLFLAPPFPRAECGIVPARLVRGLMDTQRSTAGITRESVARTSRSLSQWWMGELVSLWSGDERRQVLAQATRLDERGPDFVVRLRVRSSRSVARG
ncbi:hypothetical protein LZ198_32025 [Myxococcus sp. K15C18031901]|uniref:hypothetical protein n=1 Tax=Myxococcus dinghuensis TaxID=2906761 RepID=UPI0020A7D098|nr:hypothetical protein [Myxococcus dinghuensis]MCP3103522.1 hypothetical protein [Myxococcus dinghuensis]